MCRWVKHGAANKSVSSIIRRPSEGCAVSQGLTPLGTCSGICPTSLRRGSSAHHKGAPHRQDTGSLGLYCIHHSCLLGFGIALLILCVKKGASTRSSPQLMPPNCPHLHLQPRPAGQEGAGEDFQATSWLEMITNHWCLLQEETWCLSYK